MRRLLLSLPFLLLSLFCAFHATADDSGTMIWGSVAAVPTVGLLGGGLLLGLLASLKLRRARLAGTGLGLLLALTYTPSAWAVTYDIVDGQLMGASGILVDGALYSVQFIDGSCVEAYNGCDEASDFTFQTFDVARNGASQALYEQVLVDTGVPGEEFESSVDLVNGCSLTNQCRILTAYTVDPELNVHMIIMRPSPSLDTSLPSGISLFDPAQSTVSESDTVYAVWSPAAAPSPAPALSLPGIALLAASLLGVGAVSSGDRQFKQHFRDHRY